MASLIHVMRKSAATQKVCFSTCSILRSFLSVAESDLSFVSSGRPSSTFPISMDSSHDLGLPPRLSNSSDTDAKYSAPRLSNSSETESRLSFGSSFSATRLSEANGFSSNSFDSGNGSWSSPSNMVCISTSTTGVSSKSKISHRVVPERVIFSHAPFHLL